MYMKNFKDDYENLIDEMAQDYHIVNNKGGKYLLIDLRSNKVVFEDEFESLEEAEEAMIDYINLYVMNYYESKLGDD